VIEEFLGVNRLTRARFIEIGNFRLACRAGSSYLRRSHITGRDWTATENVWTSTNVCIAQTPTADVAARCIYISAALDGGRCARGSATNRHGEREWEPCQVLTSSARSTATTCF